MFHEKGVLTRWEKKWWKEYGLTHLLTSRGIRLEA